jgi:hypothetical protein
MNITSIFLSFVSLAILLLGLYAWRLTSSRPLIINMLFGSAGFLIAAYGFASGQRSQMCLVIPFFITMLIAGRALGVYWRTYFRGEKELRLPSHLVGAAAAVCMVGTVAAFLHQ